MMWNVLCGARWGIAALVLFSSGMVVLRFIYSVWAYLVFVLLLLPASVLYTLIPLLKPKGYERAVLYVNNGFAISWGLLTFNRFKVRIPDAVKEMPAGVLVLNHTSTLDMLAASYSLRKALRILAKKELRRVPLLGYMFSKMCVFVDRSSPESRKQSKEVLASVLAEGTSLCIFVEGTRNRTGKPLGKFYEGGFKLAIQHQVPVVPVVLLHARALMPVDQHLLRPGLLEAVYLDPVPTIGMTEEDSGRLKDDVWQLMHDCILEHDKAFRS